MQQIPVTNDNDQIFTTVLGGQSVRVRLIWQDRGEGWYFSLLKTDGTPILQNYRVKSGIPVIGFKLVDFEGDVIASRLDVNAEEPGRNAWNQTHSLFFLTAEEAATVRANL